MLRQKRTTVGFADMGALGQFAHGQTGKGAWVLQHQFPHALLGRGQEGRDAVIRSSMVLVGVWETENVTPFHGNPAGGIHLRVAQRPQRRHTNPRGFA